MATMKLKWQILDKSFEGFRKYNGGIGSGSFYYVFPFHFPHPLLGGDEERAFMLDNHWKVHMLNNPSYPGTYPFYILPNLWFNIFQIKEPEHLVSTLPTGTHLDHYSGFRWSSVFEAKKPKTLHPGNIYNTDTTTVNCLFFCVQNETNWNKIPLWNNARDLNLYPEIHNPGNSPIAWARFPETEFNPGDKIEIVDAGFYFSDLMHGKPPMFPELEE